MFHIFERDTGEILRKSLHLMGKRIAQEMPPTSQ